VFPVTFFDYNGVLVDDEDVHLEAYRRVLAPFGVRLARETYFARYAAYDDAGGFSAMLADAGLRNDVARVRALIEAKRPVYLSLAYGRLVGFPGAAELVRHRALAGPVLVVSGALREEIQLGLETLGVSSHVTAIVAAGDVASKPDPAGYLLARRIAAEHAGEHAAAHALVVEDTPGGVRAAKAAGTTCVAVAHTYPAPELASAGADLVLPRLGEIDDAVLACLWERVHGA
jgi:beta-phosphoglucomutase-like phosphatase (HAD superfamily)